MAINIFLFNFDMVSNKLKLIILSAICLLPFAVLAEEADKQEHASNTELVTLIRQLSDRFIDGKLSVSDLEKQLSTTALQSENKKYWSIDSNKYNLRCTAKSVDKISTVEVLDFYTNELRQLALKDLEILFGNSRVIAPSRDLWIEFPSRERQDGKNVSIAAHLYGHLKLDVSPVLLVQLILE